MKAFCLGLAFVLLAAMPASAADTAVSRKIHRGAVVTHRVPAVPPLPLALRTLSKRSAAVLASTPCWRGCTALCGADVQACLRFEPLVGCLAFNNQCELTCLRQCRFLGGPLVSWTDY